MSKRKNLATTFLSDCNLWIQWYGMIHKLNKMATFCSLCNLHRSLFFFFFPSLFYFMRRAKILWAVSWIPEEGSFSCRHSSVLSNNPIRQPFLCNMLGEVTFLRKITTRMSKIGGTCSHSWDKYSYLFLLVHIFNPNYILMSISTCWNSGVFWL